MRILISLIVLATSSLAYGQKDLFKLFEIDSTTKIIGRYPHYDKTKSYENLNFIIEDSLSIKEFLKILKLGEEVPNSMERPNFRLTLIKNHNERGVWTINPNQKSAMTHDGHTYAIDIDYISSLNKKFPFKYVFEKKIFNSKKEYNSYLSEQKKNPNFLFDYPPQFKHEGSFEIEFKKSKKFASPKAIHEFLTPYIEKIVSENEYRISYVLNGKNMTDRSQYTMTITGSKKIFINLNLKNLSNKNWQSTIDDGYFFYKE